jgi:hypothetical protein
VANESGPGRATATGFWTIVFDADASNDMFADLDAKRVGYDWRDTRTTEAGIAALELNNGTNEFIRRTFRSGLRSFLCRVQPTVFAAHQAFVEIQ